MEYETIILMGSNCGIDDLDVIAKMNRICDELGIDTMEKGATIGVIMESVMIYLECDVSEKRFKKP